MRQEKGCVTLITSTNNYCCVANIPYLRTVRFSPEYSLQHDPQKVFRWFTGTCATFGSPQTHNGRLKFLRSALRSLARKVTHTFVHFIRTKPYSRLNTILVGEKECKNKRPIECTSVFRNFSKVPAQQPTHHHHHHNITTS